MSANHSSIDAILSGDVMHAVGSSKKKIAQAQMEKAPQTHFEPLEASDRRIHELRVDHGVDPPAPRSVQNGNTKNPRDAQRARVLAGEHGAGWARNVYRALRPGLLKIL